jgi:hypothetical protein
MQGILTRRRFSQALLALATVAAVPLRALAARNEKAFKATATEVALKELFGDKAMTETDAFEFKVPDIAEDGSIVPVTVSTEMDGVKSITCWSTPIPTRCPRASISCPVRYRSSRPGSRWARVPTYTPSSRPRRPLHSAPRATSRSPLAAVAAEPSRKTDKESVNGSQTAVKIRARLKGERGIVKCLMPHPMETGVRKDLDGKLIPAHYIERVDRAPTTARCS